MLRIAGVNHTTQQHSKIMFKQERQALLTYTTWRWMWLIIPVIALMILGACSIALNQKSNQVIFLPAVLGIGMPVLICMQWFIAVAKWQFANPRARLIPGYKSPHLSVIATGLATLLVLNPLLLSFCLGISPLGPLAFALLLGGVFLQALIQNAGTHALPAIIVFFSGMYPTTSRFWFSGVGDYGMIHSVFAITGLALVIAWLWRLANLNEEMGDYQVMPLGAPGSLSRLELAEQRRLQGQKAARSNLINKISDIWHDQIAQKTDKTNQPLLAEYGWGQFPGILRALLAGLGCAIYGIGLSRLTHYYFSKPLQTSGMIAVLAIALPAISTAFFLRQRRPRLSQEILRPVGREEYFNLLFKALAKQAAWLWLSLSCCTLAVLMFNGLPTNYKLNRLIIGYLLWTPCVQILVFAVAIYIARWRSNIAFTLTIYAMVCAITGLLIVWASSTTHTEFIPTSVFMGSLFAILGLWLMPKAKGSWLRIELG